MALCPLRRLSARESCPVCFHAIFVSFAIWLILLYYITFTNFCAFFRAKVSKRQKLLKSIERIKDFSKFLQKTIYLFNKFTPLSTLYNSLILKGLKFNSFLAKNCKPSIYRALEKRVESQVMSINF